jgi:hypothetical protein
MIDIVVNAVNDAPALAGDLTPAGTVRGGFTRIMPDDLTAIDPDAPPADTLVYTVMAGSSVHGYVAVGAPDKAHEQSSFTQSDLLDSAVGVYFVHDGSDPEPGGLFRVSLSDGVSQEAVEATVTVAVTTARINVLTNAGFDFESEDPIVQMGLGALGGIQKDATDPGTGFTIVFDGPGDASADRRFVFEGKDFKYDDATNALTGGRITAIHEFTNEATAVDLVDFIIGEADGDGQPGVSAAKWYNGIVDAAEGDRTAFEALVGTWSLAFGGADGPDDFGASDSQDIFIGRGGDDEFNGNFDFDRANYTDATDGIEVDLANGIVTGDASVGTDTLRSIEVVGGTEFADVYVATGFGLASPNAGSTVGGNTVGTFNRFEGRGDDDTIIGNDETQVSYVHAFGGVTVDLDVGVADGNNPLFPVGTVIGQGAGTAPGDIAKVGTDLFSHVNRVVGSYFDDILLGSNNPSGTSEIFEGRGGNDFINGNGGTDVASYSFDPADQFGDGINVQLWLGAGTVTGGFYTGSDDLRSIEGIGGTEFDDHYDASNFGAGGFTDPNIFNVGNSGTLNFVEGRGGNDTVTGNFGTRVQYTNAAAGVTVVLGASGSGALAAGLVGSAATAHYDLLSFDDVDPAGVGLDVFKSGVAAIRGSQFGDFLQGNGGTNALEGQGGRDYLRGLDGSDTLTGGTGADIFGYTNPTSAGGKDFITDFNKSSGIFDPSEGDRIDLTPFTTNTGANLDFLTQVGSDTVITFFGTDNTLNLQNTNKDSLTFSDFIFSGQVAVTVQSPDGYDFSTLYDDLAAASHDTHHDASTRFVAIKPDSASGKNDGRIFVLTSSTAVGGAFTYNAGGAPIGGIVFAITIYDTSYNMLVSSRAWNVSLPTLVTAIQDYDADHSQTAGLDDIFNATRYSIAGSAGAQSESGSHLGADVFFGGDKADVFNGFGGPFGPFDPGNDTVDYSHASAGVTASLANPASNTGAAAGDIYLSIENLRGSKSSDTLTGDGNNNVLEGGDGDDTLTAGGGVDIASYEHATAGVNVSLTLQGVSQITGGAGNDTLSEFENLRGSAFTDTLEGDANFNVFEGLDGDDTLKGGGFLDRAIYAGATGPISVDMKAGTVSGKGVGTDTLISVEQVDGTNFADTFVATGYAGSSAFGSSQATFNEFQGMAGDDIITGNGATLLSYLNATSGVTVDIAAGIATGNDSVGNDSFTGVQGVRGSFDKDILLGSNSSGVEVFEGRGGDDDIDGRGGFDRVIYSPRTDDMTTGGIDVKMAVGTVDGDAFVGFDTLRSIEGVRGTKFGDTYDATGFGAPGLDPNTNNVGSNGTFNEFEGLGGVDIITGNGNTRIAYINATAGVSVDLKDGTASGDSSVDNDEIKGGVFSVVGSNFVDTLSGSDITTTTEFFEGRGQNDTIDGRGGIDQANYGNDPTVTTGITVNLADGKVFGDATIGTDTLVAVEEIRATNFEDTYNAVGFGQAGAANVGSSGTFNAFEGLGGNDQVIGNGNTRIMFFSATAGVTVDLDVGLADGSDPLFPAGTVIGTAFGSSVGTDTLSGVSRVSGSNFNDLITGDAGNNLLEGQNGTDTLAGDNGDDRLGGGAGNDSLVGGAGLDRALYSGASPIAVNLAAGTVSIGADTDTLQSIELVGGSNNKDTFVATGFSGSSPNAGDFGTFNGFEGMGGDDTITGNGDTRIEFSNASNGVTVTFNPLAAGEGSVFSTAGGDAAGIGTDTFTGVHRVLGSQFADDIGGDAGSNFFEGGGGGDKISGGASSDVLHGNAGSDTINGGDGADSLYGEEGNDVLTGGADSDTFVFQFDDPSFNDGHDTIQDFDLAGADQDFMDVSALGIDEAELQALLDNAAPGETLNLSANVSVTLTGVDVSTQLSTSHFVFQTFQL